MIKTIDLHTHSFFSDGQDSPEILLGKMEKARITLGAITDHNYLSEEVLNLSKKYDFLIPGVEVSCVEEETEESLHILGLSKNLNRDMLNRELSPIVNGYNQRAQNIIEMLNKKYIGINFQFDDLRKKYREAYISRNTLARELSTAIGAEKLSFKEALKEAFVPEDDEWMPRAEDAIKIILNAGGIPILAHPGRIIKHVSDFRGLVARLVKAGLLGMEVEYPKHSLETVEYLKKLGKDFGLMLTAGSDWHGEFYTSGEYQGYEVDDERYEKLKMIFSK
jgi:predicted metal-dependent phosphoesterase TrpH